MAEKHSHEGHRSRLRKRYLDYGIDNFENHEILEMLLYNCYTRRNTSDIAHKLIERFGSISAVFDAPVDLLVEAGVSESVAAFLHMIPDVSRIYLDDRNKSSEKVIQLKELCDYFKNKFIGRKDEAVYLLLLDNKKKELFSGVVATGTSASSDVPLRKIVDLALRYNATFAVIAHNHLSGMAVPSKADMQATQVLSDTLRTVGINLLDHIIIADDDSSSLRTSIATSTLLVWE